MSRSICAVFAVVVFATLALAGPSLSVAHAQSGCDPRDCRRWPDEVSPAGHPPMSTNNGLVQLAQAAADDGPVAEIGQEVARAAGLLAGENSFLVSFLIGAVVTPVSLCAQTHHGVHISAQGRGI